MGNETFFDRSPQDCNGAISARGPERKIVQLIVLPRFFSKKKYAEVAPEEHYGALLHHAFFKAFRLLYEKCDVA